MNRSAILLLAALIGACHSRPPPPPPQASETADEFVDRVNRELTALGTETQVAGFTQATFINPDTEFLSAQGQRPLSRLRESGARRRPNATRGRSFARHGARD